MKKLTIFTIFLITAGLFTGCRKDESKTSVTPTYSSTIDYNYNTSIAYTLALQRPTGNPMTGGNPLMNWDNGYIHVSGLVLNAGAPYNYKFGAQVDKTMSTFGPEVLGVAKTPSIKPSAASFTIQVTPVGTQHALVLNGIYYNTPDMPFAPPPRVQFIVDEAISLNSVWLSGLELGTGAHTANMQLDLASLTAGIDYSIMNGAVITGDLIVISSTSNGKIYEVMLNNLKNIMMSVQFKTAQTPQTEEAKAAVQ